MRLYSTKKLRPRLNLRRLSFNTQLRQHGGKHKSVHVMRFPKLERKAKLIELLGGDFCPFPGAPRAGERADSNLFLKLGDIWAEIEEIRQILNNYNG